MTIVHVTLQFPIYSYYPENTVSVDPSLVCIVINRGIRTPPPTPWQCVHSLRLLFSFELHAGRVLLTSSSIPSIDTTRYA